MPDENRKVNYSFTGDSSSLADAAKRSMKLLKQYGKVVQNAALQGDFSKSAESFRRLNSTIRKASDPIRQLEKTISEFDRYQKKVSGVINGVDALIDKNRRLTKSAKESAQVFMQFFKMDEKGQRAKNGVDRLIESQQRLTKSAKESAQVYEDLYRTQNQFNRSTPGYSTTEYTPSKSAAESASVFQQVDKNLGSFSKYFDTLGSSVGTLSSVLGVLGKVNVVLAAAIPILQGIWKFAKPILNGLKSIIGKVGSFFTDKFTAPFRFFSENAGLFKSILSIGAGYLTGKGLAEFAKDAIDMTEAVNLFTVAMKDNIKTGREFIYNTSEMYGLDPTSLMSKTGIFYEMGAAVDMPGDVASKLALSLTSMTTDISSLFNVDFDTVAENLSSGMRGMSRAVLKYGMDIRASTVEAFAQNQLGIQENFETMNEASREILRFLVMVNQAQDAMGDFAATIESPANQLRVLKEQAMQLGRTIGRYLVSAFGGVIPYINGFVMALRLVLETIADIIGIFSGASLREDELGESSEGAADGIAGIGDAAGGAADELKQLIAPFDELNILSENLASGGGGVGGLDSIGDSLIDPKILAALDKVDVQLEKIRMKAHDVRDAILEFLGLEYAFELDPITGEVINRLNVIPGQFADQLIKAWEKEDWGRVGSLIASKLNPLVYDIANALSWKNVGPGATKAIKGVAEGLNGFIKSFEWWTLGRALGEAFNTAIHAFMVWLESFDYRELGKAIAESLNGFIKAQDPGVVGKTLALYLNSITEFAAGFDQEFDWHDFGNRIRDTMAAFFETYDFNNFLDTAVSIINHIIEALVSIIDEFTATGKWGEIGKAIGEALAAINWGDFLVSAAEALMQGFVGLLEGMMPDWLKALFGIITWPNSMVNSAANSLKNLLTGNNKNTSTTSKPSGNKPTVTKPGSIKPGGPTFAPFAVGGVVTRPTRALIGEAGYPEAVIPLGESPQLQALLSQFATIARQQGDSQDRPMVVKVYLDGKEITTAQNNRNRMYGKTLQNV